MELSRMELIMYELKWCELEWDGLAIYARFEWYGLDHNALSCLSIQDKYIEVS